MSIVAVSLEAVHTHYVYKTQELVDSLESCNLENIIGIFTYALLNIHARD